MKHLHATTIGVMTKFFQKSAIRRDRGIRPFYADFKSRIVPIGTTIFQDAVVIRRAKLQASNFDIVSVICVHLLLRKIRTKWRVRAIDRATPQTTIT